jgi:hypothetical protein
VVGGSTAPSSPKTNTIWVKTDKSISKWVFDASQPTSPSSQMVWFVTGKVSKYAFNALKTNGI